MKCPRCGQLFVTSTTKEVECRYCRRRFKARDHAVAASDDLDALRERKARLLMARDGLAEEGLETRFCKFKVK
ncbi:MAG: hypothetical protein QXM08_00515 [Thermofilaceae archaeon]